MKPTVFRLMFPIEKTEYWAMQYPKGWDDGPLAAGKRIREGDYTRSNLKTIMEWKSERRVKLLDENSDSEIADALDLAAVHAREPRSAFAVLIGLRGVALPMASAILTAIHPETYTVVDWRAVESLGVPMPTRQPEFLSRVLLPRMQTHSFTGERQPTNVR